MDKISKIKMLNSIIEEAKKIIEEIESEIETSENEFDFRSLSFTNYKFVDDVFSSNRDVWFEKIDNEGDSIHVYTPESVSIENVSADDYKYIVVVEILKGCEHYKTLVLNAKAWIVDTEKLGIEQNLKNMAEYILAWGFKDREVETYK